MNGRALALLLSAAFAACGAPPSAPPPSLVAVGPLRVGMTAAEADRTLSTLGLNVECKEKNGISECRTLHAGAIALHYEVAGDRVRSATRVIGSSTPPAPAGEMAAAWEARYGPQDTAEAPAVQRLSVIRHWYRAGEGVYRVHLCGSSDGMQGCMETSMDVTPAAVAARIMSEAWDARDYGVVCHTWEKAVSGRCGKPQRISVRPLQSDEVMRIAVLREPRDTPPGGVLLFQSDGTIRHRMWRVSDGSLYGISCRNYDDEEEETCWEIVARFQPRELLMAFVSE
ncbi:MAG TPA: hypothetical protein VLK84_22860 [Longimicrobium sp.]|nr:hypothetical protein [Longimicrobium sp.]